MYRMVVVDDEYIVVEGIKTILQREKMNCEIVGFAYDGIEALRVIKETCPDIVITDIRMPGMDGLSLIEECREFLSETVYVIISGYTEFEYARKALVLDVMNYIDKPVTIEKIAEVISQLDHKQSPENSESKARKELSQAIDAAVDAAMAGNPSAFTETAKSIPGLLKKATVDFEQYKQETFKTLAMLVEIFNEHNKRRDQFYQVSYQEVEKWENEEAAYEYISRLLGELARNMQGEKTGSSHKTVKQLLQYIEENYEQNFGLNELADMAELNPAYLSILFKEEVGVSFVKYLTDLRIEKAKDFLNSGYRVGEVSDMVGYSNYRYFCDIFKKHEGKTPNEYRGCIRKKSTDIVQI